MHRSSVGEIDANVRHVFAVSSYWGYVSDFFRLVFTSDDGFNVKVAGIHEKIMMILPQYRHADIHVHRVRFS